MGCLVYAYYNTYPIRYYKDDSWWSEDLKSKTTEDIISIGSFMEVLVLILYVLVRKILEQMLLAMKNEAGGNLNDKENDFMLDNAYGDDTLEELSAAVIMMVRIQPADDKAD
ncbi:hypothetical protein Tco_0672556 [Tanacetum coccineum]